VANWQKLLRRMLTDANPIGYTYDEAVLVLSHLGFQLAPHGGGSHRKWRQRSPAGNPVVIGLVEKGSGSLKPYLVRDMIQQLRLHRMIPPHLEQE
jgi:hypothetical protein